MLLCWELKANKKSNAKLVSFLFGRFSLVIRWECDRSKYYALHLHTHLRDRKFLLMFQVFMFDQNLWRVHGSFKSHYLCGSILKLHCRKCFLLPAVETQVLIEWQFTISYMKLEHESSKSTRVLTIIANTGKAKAFAILREIEANSSVMVNRSNATYASHLKFHQERVLLSHGRRLVDRCVRYFVEIILTASMTITGCEWPCVATAMERDFTMTIFQSTPSYKCEWRNLSDDNE